MAQILAERARRKAKDQAGGWAAELARCAADELYWFDRWVYTYDPRLVGKPGGPFIKMDLWPKQRECVLWMKQRMELQQEGLLEKSRDVGATYLTAGLALHHWLFLEGFKATFGSRDIDLVDSKDNPDSIFAKIRIMRNRLPSEMLPQGFSENFHDNKLRMINPSTGATITGEGGEEMGRGGRSSEYVVDEAAFVRNAENAEAAIAGNTDCVIWVSSVNGMGNLFARKRHSILRPEQIFRLHWRDDPRKTEEWARGKEASFSDPTKWASEYEIDYSASVTGICIPAKWVESAKQLQALEPGLKASADSVLGLDVGAGKAKSVSIVRNGPVVQKPKSRGEPDTTGTALWARDLARDLAVRRLNFDAPGVGAGVASTLKHNPSEGLAVAAINTGMPPSNALWPDERRSEEIFVNVKAEIWWLCRTALQRTHEHVLFLKGLEGGKKHALDELLALPSGDRDSDQLALELSLVKWERTDKGKIMIEQKQALARRGIASPDYADALMLTFVEAPFVQMIPDLAVEQVAAGPLMLGLTSHDEYDD